MASRQARSLVRKKVELASAHMNKDGWNRKENTAGYSSQGSLCVLWFLSLGKIGVGEARYNEGGARTANRKETPGEPSGALAGLAEPEPQRKAGRAALGSPASSGLPHLASMVV